VITMIKWTEEVRDLKYFHYILCKYGSMGGVTRESSARKESGGIIQPVDEGKVSQHGSIKGS